VGLETNGTTSFVRIPRKAVLEPAAVSLCAWICKNRDPVGVETFTAVAKSFDLGATGPFASWDFEVDNSAPTAMRFGVGIGAALTVLSAGAGTSVAGRWMHFVGTYDPAAGQPRQRVYANGVLAAQQNLTGAINYDTTSDGDLFFGQDGSGVAQFAYPGRTADVRVYSRALTPEEVATMFSARGHDGIVKDLVGRWPLHERADGLAAPTSVGFVKSVSESGSDGTATASPLYAGDELSLRRKFSRRIR
jgi:hypothetical protein